MFTTAMVLPVLPGKESVGRDLASALKTRPGELQESAGRSGITLERIYLQRNPDGSLLTIGYMETDDTFTATIGSMVQSDLPIDNYFLEKTREFTGIDFRTAHGLEPERIGEWVSKSAPARRAAGTAFAVPMQPGKSEQLRLFAEVAYVERKTEMDQSRAPKGLTREEVFIQRTSIRDMLVVYLEGRDPAESNRKFAASTEPFDTWFKDSLKSLFPPHINFNHPVPEAEEIFAWAPSSQSQILRL